MSMTTETIHTCSYACDRAACTRAQRDELAARLTTETSNARGEAYTFDMIEEAWGDAVPLTKPYFDRFRARLETLRQSTAPPPAAARGDVLLQTALRNLPQYISKSGLVGPDKHSAMLCFEVIREALAAEGVQAGEVEQRNASMVCFLRAALAQQPAAGAVDDDVRELLDAMDSGADPRSAFLRLRKRFPATQHQEPTT